MDPDQVWREEPRRKRLGLLALSVLITAALSFRAQAASCTLRIEKVGAAANYDSGTAIAPAGDINGDGVPDFVIGSPGNNQIIWYLGPNGTYYRQAAQFGYFGRSLALTGDLDGDGTPELIVGAPNYRLPNEFIPEAGWVGAVRIYSGRTGYRIAQLTGWASGSGFGSSIAGGYDADGDGIADMLIGAPYPAYLPPDYTYYMLLSGVDNHSIVYNSDPNYRALGGAVAFIDDLNGDGKADYLVSDIGLVDVRSGADGGLIRRHTGAWGYGSSPPALASVGDLDGDGLADYAIGSAGAARIDIYSGATGALIRSRASTDPTDSLGASLAALGDLNGDGWPDLLAGAPRYLTQSPGSALVLSGRDLGVLCTIEGVSAGDRFGQAVASIGDLDGDGRAEFGIGAPSATVGNLESAGRARIYGVSIGPPLGDARRLTVTKESTQLTLRWDPPEAGCAGSDYAVYGGTLAALAGGRYDHAPATCSAGAATTFQVDAAGAAAYFLVSVVNGNEEGSLGVRSDGTQRPVGTPSCQAFRNAAACP